MSFQFPENEKESTKKISIQPDYWVPITGQTTRDTGGGATDNYQPGKYIGGTQPSAVGEPTSNYAPAATSSPTKAAYRSVTGAKINP